MADEEKHCGRLTDHVPHDWPGLRLLNWGWARGTYWCKGWVALDGATRPKGNTKQFEEQKRG